MTMKKNKVIIFCAPSGAGKTTLVKASMEAIPELSFSVSATTRALRGSEKDGVDYYFLSIEEFKQKIEKDEFVEWEEVYPGQFYGTLKSEVARIHSEGKTPIFDVDVKGAISLKKYFGDQALMIFVTAPREAIEARLHSRGTEDEEKIQTRLARLPEEMEYSKKADVVILNIDLEKAVEDSTRVVGEFLMAA
jgi:guanylate kinase